MKSEDQKLPAKEPPRDHGRIGTPKNPDSTPPRPKFPPALAGRFFTFDSLESMEEREAKYGIWKMKALMDFTLGFGRYVSIGDTFSINGKNAARLCELGCAEFIDEKMQEQLSILEKARKIMGPINPREMPENFPQTPRPEPQRRGPSW